MSCFSQWPSSGASRRWWCDCIIYPRRPKRTVRSLSEQERVLSIQMIRQCLSQWNTNIQAYICKNLEKFRCLKQLLACISWRKENVAINYNDDFMGKRRIYRQNHILWTTDRRRNLMGREDCTRILIGISTELLLVPIVSGSRNYHFLLHQLSASSARDLMQQQYTGTTSRISTTATTS